MEKNRRMQSLQRIGECAHAVLPSSVSKRHEHLPNLTLLTRFQERKEVVGTIFREITYCPLCSSGMHLG